MGDNVSDLPDRMEQAFRQTRRLYPTAADIDFPTAVREFDRERLASEPDPAEFPELKGHIDLLRGERDGFMETSGLDETASAFHFSWLFYVSRRLTSRHVARHENVSPPRMCTNVFFPHGAQGVTLSDNRDDVPNAEYAEHIPHHRPEGLLRQDPVHWCQGGVSSAVLLDDEPDCLFPANPQVYDLMPDDCLDRIDSIIEFMTRYKDFWGPANQIWCDRSLRAVAVEKTNCRLAIRKPGSQGSVAVTACSYLDDELHDFKMDKLRLVMEAKRETADECIDVQYDLGSRKRYRRLVDQTNAEAERGATLWGALAVVADHAVPYPDRVCLAGERDNPDKQPVANWSLTQHAAVITGPYKRCLYRSIQDLRHPRPVYEYKPKLMLGPGVAMHPKWQKDIDAGRCELSEPVKAESTT